MNPFQLLRIVRKTGGALRLTGRPIAKLIARHTRLGGVNLIHGLAMAAGLAMVSSLAAEDALPPKENVDLYLLVGQSNMAGRGQLTDADRLPVAGVFALNAENQWVPAVDPLHFDKPKVVGVGLGRTFGIEVAKDSPGRVIGLIPCAVGGTRIDAWQPGAYDTATKTHPWDDAIRRAKIALQAGTLRAILWHQGEGDSSASMAPTYEKKLHELVARFRHELDAPHVPFIVGQLGKFDGRPWNEHKQMVDQAHQDLPKKVAATAFVSADGLVDGGDQTHFDADSLREFGRRYAQAYRQLVKQMPQP